MQGLSTPYSLIAAGSDNATCIKAGNTRLRGVTIHNASAAVRYVKFYDKATAPASTDTPVLRFYIPAGGTLARHFAGGFPFAAGLGFRTVNLQADNDATAVTAGDLVLNIEYE
jgi:hypothetical protein